MPVIPSGKFGNCYRRAITEPCSRRADIQLFSRIEPKLVWRRKRSFFPLEGSMTRETTNIPERWLDLLTGYVEVALIIGAGVWVVTMAL